MVARIIQFPKIHDRRGNLSFLENINQIPFVISRVFWIYDVPGGEIRGGHAYKQQQEVIIALSGSFDVIVNDGTSDMKFQLNRSYYGLYLPAGVWRHMENFSTNSVSLHMSDVLFDESDYIREFPKFIEYADRTK
jgi:hypothetical protein